MPDCAKRKRIGRTGERGIDQTLLITEFLFQLLGFEEGDNV